MFLFSSGGGRFQAARAWGVRPSSLHGQGAEHYGRVQAALHRPLHGHHHLLHPGLRAARPHGPGATGGPPGARHLLEPHPEPPGEESLPGGRRAQGSCLRPPWW